MSSEISELPYSSLIRTLSIVAGVFTVVGTISGVTMLLMKWDHNSAPQILSVLPMLLLPAAFICLVAVLFLAVLRRRAS
ncbi:MULTISPECIES: hypothetical protein [Rothia]|uniref:Amino acid transporter n=1 Tax=Rothia endophytica TaxID=1324766 RepID=A0ABP9B327_9MICC|nr:hypothetical protein [Rothia sp. P100]MCM3509849.1 hypothetical protein [Rothia sp. P100]